MDLTDSSTRGGIDNGATVNNVNEKNINLEIVYKLKDALTNAELQYI